ncbi:hypothetical protein PAMP_022604 [Pampus punctatissimus]
MCSNTLSAVLEKQIRRLCLNDFPCGHGSWRKTRDSTEGAETEETDALLDLLSCSHSPWRQDESWSPQAPALRRLAVLTPELLHRDFVYNYFTTLRIVDKDVSVIDDGLLKFSKLEELVLSANKISKVPAENLPSNLKILELRANLLVELNCLTKCSSPRLLFLGLGSNNLGSHEDVTHLTGRNWPQLVCLDLSDCEFQAQQTLLNALSTLPCLRTLVLEGNPLTLVPSYPGFTVDSLPQLSCLDASWISPEERHGFRGMAKMSDLIVDWASATVSVGRVRGISDPLMSVDENAPDFPVVTYSYFITYVFLSHQTNQKVNSEFKLDTTATEDSPQVSSCDVDLQLNRNYERKKSETRDLMMNTKETLRDIACESRHSTSKLTWSECMNFCDTQTYIIRDLGSFKKFLNQGFNLRIEEEKVQSWPAASEDIPVAKKEKKGGKGKDPPIKSGSTKDKSKDKRKKSMPELVHDAPVRRVLGSVHVPLQSLIKGGQKVDVLCDLGVLHTEPEKIKEDKKEEEKESKWRGSSSAGQKSTAASKGKGKVRKEREVDVHKDSLNSVSVRLEPVTVELSVELEKWKSASEATKFWE